MKLQIARGQKAKSHFNKLYNDNEILFDDSVCKPGDVSWMLDSTLLSPFERKSKMETVVTERLPSCVKNWLGESREVVLLVLRNENNVVCCIAFLSAMDFDPLNQHLFPYCLDFIYTPTLYRRCGHARMLLEYLRKRHHITAMMASMESELLFANVKYIRHEMNNNVVMYRFP